MPTRPADPIPPGGSAPDLTVTPGELIQRAREMIPRLVERQAQTEANAGYPDETHEEFEEAGFYWMLHPRRYGGYEVDLDTYFQVVMELARGCPSTAWNFTLGSTHVITVASYLSEAVQDELLGGGYFIAPSVSKPTGKAKRAADGGWIVSGEFPFASGISRATHFLGHTLIEPEEDGGEPEMMFFVAEPQAYTVLNDWGPGSFGFKGTGSHTVVFDEGYVPERLAWPGVTDLMFTGAERSVGLGLHDNPMYGGSILSLYLIEIAAIFAGAVLGGVDEYERLMTKSDPPHSARFENPEHQRIYGRALGQATMAQFAVRGWLKRWLELAAADGFDPFEDVRLIRVANEILVQCFENMSDHVLRRIGPGEVREGTRTMRLWRDLSTIYGHYGTGLEMNDQIGAVALARLKFGLAEPGFSY